MSKILTVFGATGNQGGSVIASILADATLSSQFTIRGVTRDASKPAAQALASRGVQLVKADMSTAEQAAPAVAGAHTVFIVTNFWESMNANTEYEQGKAVVDACAAAGVKHIIFSSLIDVTAASGGALSHVSHFDSKAKVEAYIRSKGLPGTYVMPGVFMSAMLGGFRKQGDAYVWALPEGADKDTAQLPLFDAVHDMGKFVKAAIKTFPDSVGRQFYAATDYYTPVRMADEFTRVTGKTASVTNVPQDVFKSFLPPAAAQELLENMLLFQKPGYYAGASLAESVASLDTPPTTWAAYLEEKKSEL